VLLKNNSKDFAKMVLAEFEKSSRAVAFITMARDRCADRREIRGLRRKGLKATRDSPMAYACRHREIAGADESAEGAKSPQKKIKKKKAEEDKSRGACRLTSTIRKKKGG